MATKRYDADAAARRTRDATAPVTTNSAAAGSSEGPTPFTTEYRLLAVSMIDPAPWQARVVFDGIEELAASIRGDGETPGVGIVEPVLVRQMPSGRYELIDGERRWRAAMLIASARSGEEFLIPARVFRVSDHLAQLIGFAANIERDEPKALETAMAYRRLREALQQENPGQVIGIRKVVGLAWHERTEAGNYLKIGETLTPEILRQAGVADEHGIFDAAVVTRLSKSELSKAAKAATDDERVSILRAKVDRIRGLATNRVADDAGPTVPVSAAERLERIRDVDGLSLRVRVPLGTLPRDAARRLLDEELTPAMLVCVEQAYGPGGDGCLVRIADGHTIIVLPRDVEQLSMAQLETLGAEVQQLAKRVARTMRFRRGRKSATARSGDGGPSVPSAELPRESSASS